MSILTWIPGDEQPQPKNYMHHNFRLIMVEAHSLHFLLPLCEISQIWEMCEASES